jgi:predicted ATPase
MDRFVVISGCSGGGKSTLLTELGRRGYAIVEEPGRRIVKQELAAGGSALPWLDAAAFARRAIAISHEDRAFARTLAGWVFFDRGLIDAAAGLQQLTGEPALTTVAQSHRYHRRVFLVPPWPEIYLTDRERRHGFAAALGEYSRLRDAYPALGYQVYVLPKVGVVERADYVLRVLGAPSAERASL